MNEESHKKYLEKINDRVHFLETLIRTQVKIINDLRKQISHMQKNRENIAAPKNSICSCCTLPAVIVGNCGHYFCTLCIERYHHIDCVSCELSDIEENE